MTETTEETEVEATDLGEPPPDLTPVQLRTYGLSGEPVRMAPSNWQMVVAATRNANVGELDSAQVQPLINATFPGAGYQASDIVLAHPPVGDFTATVTDNSVRVDLAGDADLGLPDDNVEWSFGDGTPVVRDAGGWDHAYDAPGDYTVGLTVLVAGRVYASSQDVEAGEAPPPPEVEPTAAEGEFDPADHNVEDVLGYVDEHPDELGAVTSAEESGKARVTLLEKLYAKAD